MPSGGGGGQSLTIPVTIADGGTGQVTAAAALAALGGVATSSLPLAIASGGTGQITAAAALAALGGVGAGRVYSAAGDNGGDITISATAWGTAIQTAFKVTATIPVGSVAVALLVGSGKSGSGTTLVIGIDVDGSTSGAATQIAGNLAGFAIPFTCMAKVIGDGASHVITPQAWKAGGTNCIIQNSGNNDSPLLIVMVIPAT